MQPEPSRSRRRWILLSVGVVLLLGLAIATWQFLPGWLSSRAVAAIQHVSAMLDVQVEYDELRLEGSDRLILQGIRVYPEDALSDEEPLVVVDEMVVHFSIASIWQARVRIDRVTISSPQLALIRRADRTDNFGRVVAKLKELLGPRERGESGGSQSGVWAYLEPHVPSLEVTDGDVTILDSSEDRSLLPAGLPAQIAFPGLSIALTNEAVMTDELRLSMEVSADVPLLQTRARGVFEYDREKDRVVVGLNLEEPCRFVIGEDQVVIRHAAWFRGGTVRLQGIEIGEQFRASEVALELGEPGTASESNPFIFGPDELPTLRTLITRVRKLTVTGPEIQMTPDGTAPEWVRAFVPATAPPIAPAAESTAEMPTAERPALKDQGEEVREQLRTVYSDAVAMVHRFAATARVVGRRVPLPHLQIRGARLVYPSDLVGVPNATALLKRGSFDVDIERSEDDMLTVNLTFPRAPDTPAGIDELSARLALATGDLQVHVRVSELPLHPFRAFFGQGDWLRFEPTAKLRDTDLRIVYGATSERFAVQGRWQVDGLALDISSIASEVMHDLHLGGEMRAVLNLSDSSLKVEDGILRVGEVPVVYELKVDDFGGAPVLGWRVDVARVPAQGIVDALPDAFLGQLAGLQVNGDVAWSHAGSLDSRDMSSLQYTSEPRVWGFDVTNLGRRVDFRSVTRRFVHRAEQSDGSFYEFTTGPGGRRWVSLRDVSEFMPKVLTTTEDATFWRHDGVAFFAIRDAMVENLQKGYFHRGASTITQQLVKNLFLVREKTISRKVQELFLAWRFEQFLSKERILELYLNIVELGPRIYGLKRAAQYYFDKEPATLSLTECAFLASILPNPRRYHYHFRRGEVSEVWRKGLERTIRVMERRGKITAAQARAASPYSPEFRDPSAGN